MRVHVNQNAFIFFQISKMHINKVYFIINFLHIVQGLIIKKIKF